MKFPGMCFGVSVLLACMGCNMKKITYKHVVFDENASLKVIERSQGVEKSSDGKPLLKQVVGLPIHLQVMKSLYKIDVFTPINAEPVVFLDVLSGGGKVFTLKGAHLQPIKANYQYSFLVDGANGAPVQVEILDATGERLGLETLTYKVINRGYTYCLDSL